MAAGKGTRLKSKHPKVLHEVGGKPLLAHVVAAAAQVVPPNDVYVIIGHEAERGTLKYRCPARHCDWECPSNAACNGERKYGLTVRVKQEIDLRRFPSIPRATKQFGRLYKDRTAVERVNARLKIFWLFRFSSG